MSETVITPEKLDELERLADESKWNPRDVFIALRFREAANPAAILALIERVRELEGALQTARNGLVWYQEEYPDCVNGCDDEAMAEIDAALNKEQK